ncbi:MAG TPA: hypothetical protein VF199_06100 [Bacillales bacterium]
MTKSGMRGFAAGLWVAAIVMAYFFYTGQGPAETAAKQTVTEEQVKHYLESRDQIAVEKGSYESLKAAADQQTENKDQGKSEKNQSKEDEGKKNKEDKSGDSNDQQKAEEKVKTYTLDIQQGMTSQEVGNLLENAGIIKDQEKLSEYLQDHDLAKKVQLGTFKLKSDMSIAEIAEEITS